MKAYFYCRVAHDDSFSLERQAKELRRYAEQAGYTIVGAAAEHGSGMTLDRPALQEVMEAVLAGKVDVVLISSLDRIGRDWGMTKQYIDLLTEHKVKLLCLRERVSTDSSGFSPASPLIDFVILFFNYHLIEFYHRIFTYSILFCTFCGFI